MLTPLRSLRSWPTSLGAPVAAVRSGRNRPVRGIGKVALTMMAVGLLAGCSANGELDNSQNNVVLQIEAIELVSSPWGDVLTSGGTILDDTADVTFTAVLKGPISTNPLNSTPELQNVQLEKYEVTFTRTDGGTAVPPGFTRGIAGLVRLTELGAEEIIDLDVPGVVIVPSTIKAQPPISFLIDPGTELGTNFPNIQVNAQIRFFGRTIAGDQVTAIANIGVNFANYGDDNS